MEVVVTYVVYEIMTRKGRACSVQTTILGLYIVHISSKKVTFKKIFPTGG